MLQRFNTLGRRLSAAFTEDDLMALVGDAPLIKVGNTWRVRKTDNVLSTNFNAAVANGATCGIYGVTAGSLAVITMLQIMTSIAGRLTVRYNGVNIASATLPANSSLVFTFPNGWVTPTTGGLFDIVNNTGAASDLAGAVSGAEYTP